MQHCPWNMSKIYGVVKNRDGGETHKNRFAELLSHAASCARCAAKLQELEVASAMEALQKEKRQR